MSASNTDKQETWPECNTCDGRGCPSCEKTGFQFNEDESLDAYKFGVQQGRELQRIADLADAAAGREARAALREIANGIHTGQALAAIDAANKMTSEVDAAKMDGPA